jgi:ribosomal protein L29
VKTVLPEGDALPMGKSASGAVARGNVPGGAQLASATTRTGNGAGRVVDSWQATSDPNDMRRVELLKRLNQIERQRNELTRGASLTVDSPGDRSAQRSGRSTAAAASRPPPPPVSHPYASRPLSSKRARPSITGELKPAEPKRRRSDTVMDSNSDPAHAVRSSRAQPARPLHSPAVSARAQNSSRPPTPSLDLGAVDKAHNFNRSGTRDVPRESGAGPRNSSPKDMEVGLEQFVGTPSPPGSPGSFARGSARVRTPSVLLAKQPGEGPPPLPGAKAATKNNQVSYCLRLVKDMLRLKDAYAFSKPIDQLWPRDQLPGYFEMITKPMDLSTIRDKLEAGAYTRDALETDDLLEVFIGDEYASDMRLVFKNAQLYNRPGDMFYEAAARLLEKFESKFATLPAPKEYVAGTSKKSKKKKSDSVGGGGGSKKGDSKRRKSTSSVVETKQGSGNRSNSKSKVRKSKADVSRAKAGLARKSDSEMSASPKDPNKMTAAELEHRLDALKRHLAFFDPGSPAPSPVSGAPAYLSQAQALYHIPMTFEEKYSLSQNVSRLPGDKLQKLVALVSRNTDSTMEVNNEEEIELDIDHMDNKTLRDMEAFVNHTLFRRKGVGAKGGLGSPSLAGPQSDIRQLTREQIDEEIKRIEELVRRSRVNGRTGSDGEPEPGSRNDGASQNKEKSFYDDSDSSSDSGSGSSGSSEEDSEDGSDSSDDESEGSEKRKRRERNLEHMRQRGHAVPAGATPLPSPSYNGAPGVVQTGNQSLSPSPRGVVAAKAPLGSGMVSRPNALSPESGRASSRSQ